ncbi:MAG: hypothetical protein HKL90_10660 [Elusimicrobia bacterium]|nr:hypothetical protein [Elusimicrobiota bacterium]
MKIFARAALALLLAARAYAGVALGAADAAPAAATPAGASAAAPHPSSLAADLAGPVPTLAAAAAFLAAPAAQAWLMSNHPQAYAPTVARALRLDDWRRTLTAHDDPRLLREAVLSRADDPIVHSPAALMGLVDRDPALAAQRRLYAIAALEWDALSETTRAELTTQDRGERAWAGLNLPERYDAVRQAQGALAARMITAAPGTQEYAAQYEAALVGARAVMSDDEIAARAAELARARSVAEAMTRAEAASSAAGGVADELLSRARSAEDLGTASVRVDAALAALGQAPSAQERAPAPELTSEENARLSALMSDALARELSGTPIGRETLAALRENAAAVAVGPTLPGVAARYTPSRAAVTLGERELYAFAAAFGRVPRELLSDSRLRSDAALFFAPYFVHEVQHHRQFVWSRAHAIPGGYSQEWEQEAYAAQAAFILQKRAEGPRLDELQRRLAARLPHLAAELNLPEDMDRDPAAHGLWLARTYRTVPTASRAAARLIDAALAAAPARGAADSAVDAALDAAVGLLERSRAELTRLFAARRAYAPAGRSPDAP